MFLCLWVLPLLDVLFVFFFFFLLQSKEMDKLLGWGKGVGKQIRIRIIVANILRGKKSVLDMKYRVPLTLLMKQVSTKKRVQLESCELSFIWGQNEDCSPGGSISDSSERLLQNSSGGKTICKVLVKAEFNTMKHSFYRRFFSVMRIWCHQEGT